MRRSPSPPGAAERLPFLEGLRGVAALYVVLGHFCSMADPSALSGVRSHAPRWLQQAMAPFAYGHLAVAAFIVLSGFCLQMSLFGSSDGHIGSKGRFFVRRARRILPAYYACLAISIAVALFVTPKMAGMPFEQYLPVTRENVAAHLLMVHNLSPDWMYKLNGVLWSIAIEAQLYILFPLLVWAGFKVGRPLTLFVSGLAAFAVLSLVPGAIKLYPWYLPLFALGMVSASFAFRPHLRLGTVPWLARLIAAGAFGVTIWACVHKESLIAGDVPLGLAVAAFCYASLIQPRGVLHAVLASRPLAFLGGFSYSLYLVHHPIQQTVYLFRPAWVNDQATALGYLLVCALPVCLVGSWAFSLLFERPFLRKRVEPIKPTKRSFIPCSLPLQVATPSDRAVVQVDSKSPQAGSVRSA